MSIRNALVVLAKAPLPGEVKTRLSRTLSPDRVAELSRCFFLDAMDLIGRMQDCDVLLAYSPDDALNKFPMAGIDVAECIPQGEGDLGDRMERVFKRTFSRGYSKLVLIGTDMPTMPLNHIQEAFILLEEHLIVLGPSLDGGYYLLGLRTMIPEIFEGIEWGTTEVLCQTSERVKEKGLQSAYVLPWYDVDTQADLNFLIAHLDILRNCPGERLPEHTLAFLEREGLLVKRSAER